LYELGNSGRAAGWGETAYIHILYMHFVDLCI
jgi:hypothetical protein